MRNWTLELALVVLLLMPGQAMANNAAAPLAKPAPVSYSAIPGRPGTAEGNLLQRVQGRYCRGCRLDCVAERNDCYYYETERRCRRQFTRCMRYCWERFCR